MATEFYGVDAQIVPSIGATPVSTDTNIIFVGASASGALNTPVLITSMSEYASKLGGAAGDGYNLTEAAVAAFQIAGIARVWMIPVSHSLTFNQAEYLGNAGLFTGVYAIEKHLRDNPTAVNIICAPSITDASVLAALDGIAKKAAGHWQSFLMYDVVESADQLNASNVPIASEIVEDKQLADSHALAVWGHVKTSGGYIVSGAAIRACLQAKSDADYDAPARSGGNLAIPGIQGVIYHKSTDSTADSFDNAASQSDKVTVDLEIDDATINYDGTAEYSIVEVTTTSGEMISPKLVNNSGKLAIEFKTGEDALVGAVVKFNATIDRMIDIVESVATELSADGICSYNYYGNGVYHTWGDHPSIFAGGTVSDDANRFDNYIRMQMMIANRFQLTWRFDIDEPMDLSMRNDVITYEQTQLDRLKSRGALIGNPVVEFRAADNSTSDLQQGKFVWSIETTETLPSKYMKAKIAHTNEGLSVYIEEE